jgi:hypothetical protein
MPDGTADCSLPLKMTLRESCHPEPFGCHSEQREESQDKLREGSSAPSRRLSCKSTDPGLKKERY